MKQVIYRENKMFTIDKNLIVAPSLSKKDQICNALYVAIHDEFAGAIKDPSYGKMNNFDRMQALNEFAYNWLKSRGLIE